MFGMAPNQGYSIISTNNGNKRRNLMRYKILYQRSLPSVTFIRSSGFGLHSTDPTCFWMAQFFSKGCPFRWSFYRYSTEGMLDSFFGVGFYPKSPPGH